MVLHQEHQGWQPCLLTATLTHYLAHCAHNSFRARHASACICSKLGKVKALLEFERRPRFSLAGQLKKFAASCLDLGEANDAPWLSIFLRRGRFFKRPPSASLGCASRNIFVGTPGEEDARWRNARSLQ